MTGDPSPDAGLRAAIGAPAADEPFRRALVRRQLFGERAPAPTVGRFVLDARIGAGAMGVVFRARDPRLDRPVALKLLRAGLSDRAAQRLMREARALARVEHPHVVTIYEVGDADGHPFIAMEYVAGQTLAAWQQGRSAAECLRAYTEAAAGLGALHAAGLVHRDFKPTNTLVGADGRVRVADLGLARAVDDPVAATPRATAAAPTALTATGSVLGTPAYMAPEQHAGQPATPRSDQYALCVALVEALTGRRPPLDGLEPHLRHPALSVRLRAAVRRGLSPAPADRWPDMAALVAAWSPRPARRARVVGALVIAVALGGVAIGLTRRPDPAPAPARSSAAQGVLERARQHLARDPTLAATLLAEIDPAEPGWSALARRTLATPTAWASVRVDDDINRLDWTAAHGLVARLGAHRRAAIRADGLQPIAAAPPAAASPSSPPDPLRVRSAAWQAAVVDDAVQLQVGAAQVRLDTLAEPIIRLTAEPSGRWIAAHTRRGIAVLPWPADERTARTIPGSGPLWFVDPDTVAYDAGEGVVGLLELRTGLSHRLAGHTLSVVQVLGDPTRVATVTQARVVRIWDRAALAGAPLGAHDHGIWAAARSPDGRWLATAGRDGVVGLVDLRGEQPFRRLRGHAQGAVFQVAFSPDGAHLASTGADRTARIWSMGDPARAPRQLTGHEGWAYGVGWSPDGRWIATGDRQGAVRIWPAGGDGDGRLLGRHSGDASMRRIHTLVFTGAGDAVISGAKNGTLMRWPVDGGPPRAVERTGNGSDVRRLGPDRVLAISYSGVARVLSDAGEVVATFPGDVAITGWAVTRAGDRFATAHADGSARIWDVARPAAPRWSLPPGDAPAEALAFDDAGARLAIGDTRGGVKIHRIEATDATDAQWRFTAHGDGVRALAFDGDALVSAAFDGTIRRRAVPADAAAVRALLRARVTDCLLASQRVAWLGEPEAIAAIERAICVAVHAARRAPAFAP